MYRFRHLRISLVDSPSRVRLFTYIFVRGSLRIRTRAIVHSALFASREPPRFNLCLTVFPDDAGNGFTPQSDASATSFFKRSGLSPATANSVAGVCGPTPNWLRRLPAYLRVSFSSDSSSSFSSSVSEIHRLARLRSVQCRATLSGVCSIVSQLTQAATQSCGFDFQSLSRTSCGALASKARSWLIACVRAFTALRRATLIIRRASHAPDCIFGMALLLPDRTVRAAFSASSGSDFPLRRRVERSGRLTSTTSTPFLMRKRVNAAP